MLGTNLSNETPCPETRKGSVIIKYFLPGIIIILLVILPLAKGGNSDWGRMVILTLASVSVFLIGFDKSFFDSRNLPWLWVWAGVTVLICFQIWPGGAVLVNALPSRLCALPLDCTVISPKNS
jgi:hypothetical protein